VGFQCVGEIGKTVFQKKIRLISGVFPGFESEKWDCPETAFFGHSGGSAVKTGRKSVDSGEKGVGRAGSGGLFASRPLAR